METEPGVKRWMAHDGHPVAVQHDIGLDHIHRCCKCRIQPSDGVRCVRPDQTCSRFPGHAITGRAIDYPESSMITLSYLFDFRSMKPTRVKNKKNGLIDAYAWLCMTAQPCSRQTDHPRRHRHHLRGVCVYFALAELALDRSGNRLQGSCAPEFRGRTSPVDLSDRRKAAWSQHMSFRRRCE